MPTGNVLLGTREAGSLFFRPPVAEDALSMHALVEQCGSLDINSPHCYLVLCEHFASTCVIVEVNGGLSAFIAAYIPPDRSDTLFIWQAAVDAALRGHGVAKRMIRHLLSRRNLKRVRFIEAMISPSDQASHSLFQALANECNSDMQETRRFSSAIFGKDDREPVDLIRVGPIDSVNKTLIGRK
ncbi:MAG TPA: diaminobutyrate acetyltransferase [Mariprofundaceae bacterium]|nr:diaminobutyrate acetyltransferase [Mariprofundaceae bacterium]